MAMMSDLEAQIVVVRERATVIAAGSLTDIVRTGEAFEITLRNTGSQDVAVKGVVTFSTGSTVLLQTNTTEAPAFTIRAGETRIFLAHDFLREGAIAGASFAENPIFPFTSTYQVCYSIVSSNGAQTLVSQRCIPVNARPPINESNLRSQVRRIMGFAVEWGTITLTPSGFQASGRLTVPSNSLFTVPAGRTVNFVNATIPYSALDNDAQDIEPQGGELTLVESSLSLNYQNWVPVRLTNPGGLQIRRDQTLPEVNGLRPGSIRARVLLNIDSYIQSYNVNNSALSDTVELGLAQGEVLSGIGNRLIPAVVASGNPSIASPLVVTNQNSLTWKIYGFTFGALSPVTVRVTPDTLVLTGTVSMNVPNSELTRVIIGFRFHRTGNVFTSRVNIPDTTRIGSWSPRDAPDRSVVRIAFGDGQITGSGFQFPGRVIVNARGFSNPLQFTIRRFTLAYSTTNGWSVGNTELELQSNANGRIGMVSRGRWFAFQEIDEDTATGRTTNYTVEGEGFLTVGLPLGLTLSLPTRLEVDTTGNITAEMQTSFSFKFPVKKGSNTDNSPVSIEVNSITYGSANGLVAIDGGLTLSLPSGVSASLRNLAFDNTGLKGLGGTLACEFGESFAGEISFEFSNLNDTLVWSGSGEIEVTAGQRFGMGVAFRYVDQNDFSFGIKVSRIPGIPLSTSPPTYLEQVSGSIAYRNSTWDVGIGTLITVFTPRDNLNGRPGMNLEVTGNLRFGGVGGVQFEIAGTATARGFGLSQQLGQASLVINFTNRTLAGRIAMNATLLGAVTATADVNLNIDFPRGNLLIDATVAYSVVGLIGANGRFLFKRDSAETRLFVDWNQTLINVDNQFGSPIFVKYGANVRYGFTLDINTVSVGGSFKFLGSAWLEGGVKVMFWSGSIARVSASVNVSGVISYVFSSRQLSLSMNVGVPLKGSVGDQCGCNETCFWGGTACIDLRARASYTTARGFTYSFDR